MRRRGADSAQYIRQTIVNGSDQPANDLHLEFTEGVSGARCKPKDQPPGHDGDGTVAPGNSRIVEWAPPDTFGTVDGGHTAYVDVQFYDDRPFVDEANSYWTQDTARLTGFEKKGSMYISDSQYYGKLYPSAHVQNDDTVAHSYHVELYWGNDLLNYSLDNWCIPTGTLIGPFNFELGPGEAIDLIFEFSAPDSYLLALGEGMPLGGDPDLDGYLLAAAVIPEPVTACLLALGGMALLRRR